MKFVGIIPARYASTRFPGKPLAKINGKPMVMCVYEKAQTILHDTYVATDDERIYDTVLGCGGKAIMTLDTHKSGTDRINEAVCKLEKEGVLFDCVINIQGDEPFINPSQIELLKQCFSSPDVQLATLVKKINSEEELFNPNTPKVVFDSNYNALYFSRSTIPYIRGKEQSQWSQNHTFFKHIGIYGYRTDILKKIACMCPSLMEEAESLEQLRWLENGMKIKVAVTEHETIGVDTPQDLEKALELMR